MAGVQIIRAVARPLAPRNPAWIGFNHFQEMADISIDALIQATLEQQLEQNNNEHKVGDHFGIGVKLVSDVF